MNADYQIPVQIHIAKDTTTPSPEYSSVMAGCGSDYLARAITTTGTAPSGTYILSSIGALQGLYRGSIGAVGTYGKTKDVVCKSMFTLNFKLWKGQKLRRNIKMHGELVFLSLAFRKMEKPSSVCL